jgi:hypothetical protein
MSSSSSKTAWYSKISYPVFLAGLICTIVVHAILSQKVFSPDNYILPLLNLVFHLLLGGLLWSLFAKRYTPDLLRKLLMGFFLTELVLGIFLKDLGIAYHTEITLIGLLGVLFTWFNTHSNRRNFSEE